MTFETFGKRVPTSPTNCTIHLSSIAVLLYNNMKQLFTHRRAERTTVSCEKCLNVFFFFSGFFLFFFCFFIFFFSFFSFVFVFVFVFVTCIASTSAVSRMPQSSSRVLPSSRKIVACDRVSSRSKFLSLHERSISQSLARSLDRSRSNSRERMFSFFFAVARIGSANREESRLEIPLTLCR